MRVGAGLHRLGTPTLRLMRRSVGARLCLFAAALLLLLTAGRLGEQRALLPLKDVAGGDGRPSLAFLFQPGDCAAYSGLVRVWNAMTADSALRVIGIGLGFGRPPEARDPVLGQPEPLFPVRYDLTGPGTRLLARLGRLETPTSILLDGSGRPLLILPPLADEPAQRHAAALVRAYLRGDSGAFEGTGATPRPPVAEPGKDVQS